MCDEAGDLHECDLRASHVDLPDIELLVIIDAFVHLVGFESFGCAAVHDVGDFDCLSRASQFTNDGKDSIRSVGYAENEKYFC